MLVVLAWKKISSGTMNYFIVVSQSYVEKVFQFQDWRFRFQDWLLATILTPVNTLHTHDNTLLHRNNRKNIKKNTYISIVSNCASVVSNVEFVLSLFVPNLSFFWCLGKVVLHGSGYLYLYVWCSMSLELFSCDVIHLYSRPPGVFEKFHLFS